MRYFICIIMTLLIFNITQAAELNTIDNILSMQNRAEFIDQMTQKRVEKLLPRLMKETKIDMWILISREYNEDPILKTFLPAKWLSARRTTIFVFSLEDDGTISAYAVAPYNVGNIFDKAWDKNKHPDQWQALLSLIKEKKPNKIGINQSKNWGHADGLVASEKDKLFSILPANYREKVVSAQALGVAWLEQRIPEEMMMYENIVAIAHDIIAQGFSNEIIQVGKTSSSELEWWFRERVRELKLQVWFHPTVNIQRKNDKTFDQTDSFTNGYEESIIQQGDLLHVDFGITYLRLNTDTQQHAYVLKENEQSAPKELIEAFNSGNDLQDILISNFKVDRTGNDVLKLSRKQATEQGLKPTIYTHPIGFHGHAAGTTIGMWDSQEGVAGSGDYPLHLNTVYSIELNNAVFIKSWNKEIRIMLEEEAFFDQYGVRYIDGRQTQLHLISANNH